MKVPRVLMFDAAYPPPVIGGKEKQAHLLAKTLAAHGVETAALTHILESGQPDRVDGISVFRIKSSWSRYLKFPLLLAWLRSRKNILHIHTPSWIGTYMLAWGRLLGYRVIFKLPSSNVLDTKRGLPGRIWNGCLRCADGIAALDQRSVRLLGEIGCRPEQIIAIPNGAVMNPRSQAFAASESFNIVFFGRLIGDKRCVDIIEACRQLKAHKRRWRLILVGDGPDRPMLEERARELGLDKRADFVGWQKDTAPWYEKASVVVLASVREGMSNVVLEAMSRGIPVAATAVGGTPFLLGEGAEDYLYECKDTRRLAGILAGLMSDAGRWSTYSQYLHERARCEFGADCIAERYAAVYSRLLNRR